MRNWPIAQPKTTRRDPFYDGCGGRKRCYLSEQAAADHIERLHKVPSFTGINRMNVYPCKFCIVWDAVQRCWVIPYHIGHLPRKKGVICKLVKSPYLTQKLHSPPYPSNISNTKELK